MTHPYDMFTLAKSPTRLELWVRTTSIWTVHRFRRDLTNPLSEPWRSLPGTRARSDKQALRSAARWGACDINPEYLYGIMEKARDQRLAALEESERFMDYEYYMPLIEDQTEEEAKDEAETELLGRPNCYDKVCWEGLLSAFKPN